MRSIIFTILLAMTLASCREPAPQAAAAAAPAKVRPTYDKSTGTLKKLEADSDHDGLIDTWAYMDGPRVVRVEIDENGDGTVDRWEFHAYTEPLTRREGREAREGREGKTAPVPGAVKLVRGGMESPDKTIEHIERATRRDGIVSRWEYFENGMLVRVEEDKNGDGKLDKWETYTDGSLATLAIDTTHRGRPDRRLIYRPDGTLDRIEIDPTGSGTFRPLSPPSTTAK